MREGKYRYYCSKCKKEILLGMLPSAIRFATGRPPQCDICLDVLWYKGEVGEATGVSP